MIRLALDARRLQDRPLIGVGRWLSNLLPHLSGETSLVLLTDRRKPPINGDYEQVSLAVPDNLPEVFWLQMSAARWLRSFQGVFHGTFNAVPFSYKGPSVVSIYDLSWEHHPEDYGLAKRALFMAQARSSVRTARTIITISEHARSSIIDTYKVDPERVAVAPPAVDPLFNPEQAVNLPPILDRLGVTGPYVIAMGGARRRGLEVAIEAWRRLPAGAGAPQLVVVGTTTSPKDPGIIHAGRLDDRDWAPVLAGAAVFCYPTRFEGYGMPALEAAASGTPVVCARIGPLPEILGTAAEWCATPTVDNVAPALERVLADPDRAAALRRAGLAQAAAAPTWTQSASVVLDAYRTAMD